MAVEHATASRARYVGDLSFVIVAYHRPHSLSRLLASASGQAAQIVVVNVGADTEVASAATCAGATVIDLDGNPGYAAAVNTGVASLSTRLVVFANDDLVLEPDCLPSLAAALHAGADVVVPRLARPDGRTEASIARLITPLALAGEWLALPDLPPRWLPTYMTSRLPVQKWRHPSGPELVDAAEAALVALPADLLRRYPLPEEYFLYWEEHEWFHRLRHGGCRVVYVPAARATHAGWDELSAAKSRLLARNAVRCLARTGGPRSAAVGWPIVVMWWMRLWAIDAARSRLRPSPGSSQRRRSRAAGVAAAIAAWREIRPDTR